MTSFLFLIVLEGLAKMVRKTTKKKMLDAVKIGKNEIEVNILHFTDDTLFVYEAKYQNVLTIKVFWDVLS